MSARLGKSERAAIRRSGYLLEQRLVPIIQKLGYYTIPNYSFEDPETHEAREIDIWAMGAEAVSKKVQREFIFPVLIIECKNLRCPMVFFTQSEIKSRHLMGDPHISGLPKEVLDRGARHHLSDYLNFEKFHHYYQRGRISSQFCAVFKNKKGDWVAAHEIEGAGNLFLGGIMPLVKAVRADMKEHEDSWEIVPGKEVINLQFYYPILLTKGDLFECFLGGKRPAYKRVHRISFIRRHKSDKVHGEFRIDIVTETGFKRLLKTIEQEVTEIARRIKQRKMILRESANKIAREWLRERKSTDKKRHTGRSKQ